MYSLCFVRFSKQSENIFGAGMRKWHSRQPHHPTLPFTNLTSCHYLRLLALKPMI
jgi:hypothetical protein